LIQRHHNISHQRDEVEARMAFHEDRWRIQLEMLQAFMVEEDFMTGTAELTAKGIILREIHDGNPLLLAEVLHSGVLRELDAASLVAMLSVFVADKEKEEQTVASLGLERAEREVMETLVREAERGLSKELVLHSTLPFPFTNDWTLSKKMYHAVRVWYEGGAWSEVKPYYDDFEGNFIKNILRLTNFIQSVHAVAVVIQDVALQQKLDSVQEKMIRDIVMNDSLYITSRS
jgi:superfamily II RNA helicase